MELEPIFIISNNKKFSLILTALVLIAGVVTMSLEFAASRLLIPVFGSSIYTWGSLVGVILTGLSLGYHVGGKLADKKNPTFMKFCSIIFSAGLYIVFIPFISPAVIGFSSSVAPVIANNSQYSSLLAIFTLLITPTFLLGIVSPYAVKLATKTLSKLGNIAGNLYSAATIGSIIGTFLTVFVLIPAFEIKYIIFAFGLTLIIPSSIIGLRKLPKILAGCVIVLLLLVSNTLSLVGMVAPLNPASYYYYPGGTIISQTETAYSHLDVVDFVGNNTNTNGDGNSNTRVLYLNGLQHSVMSKEDPNKLVVDYTQYFPLGFVFNPAAKNVLFVGGGVFQDLNIF
jgi:predicted membrane-bound spermidine synthase